MKDIPGFENLYAATENGQIWSYYTNKFLIPSVSKTTGYAKITLVKNKIKYTKSIHRLIAETFIPNPNNLPIVNHKDENKNNNCYTYFTWSRSQAVRRGSATP